MAFHSLLHVLLAFSDHADRKLARFLTCDAARGEPPSRNQDADFDAIARARPALVAGSERLQPMSSTRPAGLR